MSTSYIDSLPQEVWQECWTLCSPRQLRRLTLVCRLFRTICQPLLLRHLSANLRHVESKDDAERATARLEWLSEGSHPSYVRSWRFRYSMGTRYGSFRPPGRIRYLRDGNWEPEMLTLRRKIVTGFANNLHLYYNLRSLHLEQVAVDARVRSIFTALSHLESFTLTSCDITARDGDLVKLRSFKISGPHRSYTEEQRPPLRLVSAEHLRSLDVDLLSAQHLRILDGMINFECAELLHILDVDVGEDTEPLFVGFQDAIFTNLVSLYIGKLETHLLTIFFDLLQRCPQLESLTVHHFFIGSAVLPTLDPNAVPRLSALTAPLPLIGFFLPHRPVNVVSIERGGYSGGKVMPSELVGHYLNQKVLPILSRVSAPLGLRSLSLLLPMSVTPECFASIAAACPGLTVLAFDVTKKTKMDRETGGSVRGEWDTSDEEEEEDPHSANSPSSASDYEILNNVLKWIHDGSVSLPPALEVLKLHVNRGHDTSQWVSGAEEAQARAALVGLCPRLQEVQIGPVNNVWRHNGAGWRRLRV